MITGQIGVVYNPGPNSFGALVSRITRSPAFHCVVAINETECVSCEFQGAIVRDVARWGTVKWTNFAYTDEQRRGVVDWTRRRIGRPYGWLDDGIIAIHELTGWRIPPAIGHWLSADLFYMCSELATCAVFYGAGLRPFPTKYPGEVTPADWDEYLRQEGWV